MKRMRTMANGMLAGASGAADAKKNRRSAAVPFFPRQTAAAGQNSYCTENCTLRGLAKLSGWR